MTDGGRTDQLLLVADGIGDPLLAMTDDIGGIGIGQTQTQLRQPDNDRQWRTMTDPGRPSSH